MMKKIQLFIGSAFVVATVSAFAAQPSRNLTTGDYQSLNDGTGCENNSGNQPLCSGGLKICKVGTTTYYQNEDCLNPLMRP